MFYEKDLITHDLGIDWYAQFIEKIVMLII